MDRRDKKFFFHPSIPRENWHRYFTTSNVFQAIYTRENLYFRNTLQGDEKNITLKRKKTVLSRLLMACSWV